MIRKLQKLITLSGVPQFLRRLEKRNGNYVALFHGVHAHSFNIHPMAQRDLLLNQFIETLDWLEKRFHFIHPDQLFDPKIKGGVLLTFDDGFKNNFTRVMPELEKRKIPALYFISTQHIINPNNWLWFSRERAEYQWKNQEDVPAEIAEELYNGMSIDDLRYAITNYSHLTIGAHTVSHPDLPELSDDEIERECKTSKEWLEAIYGKEVEYFAYPRGLSDERVRTICSGIFKACFAVDQFDKNDRYCIPRISIHHSSNSYLNLKFSPLHKPSFREAK